MSDVTPREPDMIRLFEFLQRFNSATEWRQVGLNRVPYRFYINLGIFVDEEIAHGGCRMPGDIRVCRTKVDRQTLHCFSDDLKIAHDGILRF